MLKELFEIETLLNCLINMDEFDDFEILDYVDIQSIICSSFCLLRDDFIERYDAIVYFKICINNKLRGAVTQW